MVNVFAKMVIKNINLSVKQLVEKIKSGIMDIVNVKIIMQK